MAGAGKNTMFCSFCDRTNRSIIVGRQIMATDRGGTKFTSPSRVPANIGRANRDLKACDGEDDDDDDLFLSGPVFRSKGEGVAEPSGRPREATANDRVDQSIDPPPKARRTKARATGTKRGISEEEKESRAAERERQKRSRAADREREKELRAAEREMRRQLKARNAEREKTERQETLRREQQANGKFATSEIGVVLEKRLATTEPLGEALVRGLTEATYGVVASSEHDERAIEGCVTWVRRDQLAGGVGGGLLEDLAASTNLCKTFEGWNKGNDDNVELMETVAFVFHDPKIFLDLLEREQEDAENDQYPRLRSWIQHARSTMRKRYSVEPSRRRSGPRRHLESPPRIFLILPNVLEEISRRWNKGGRRRRSFSPTNEEEMHDAIAWMLMEEYIECEITSGVEETVEFITSMTRALSELPYYESATELDCVKKIKSGIVDKKNADPLTKAKDCWVRQLRQIPGMSEAKATCLTESYPTFRDLWEAYKDPRLTEEEKSNLLSQCLSNDARNCSKLSDSVYRFMTSTDATELL